ncbi:hypothetical protein KQI84_11795 [bacterium]|nr:hypothetical protein [bacterium]
MRSLRSNLAILGKRTAGAAAAGLVAALLLSVPQNASAVPQDISYQAYLTDSAGNPITSSSVQVTVDIYDASVGGTVLQTNVYTVDLSASRGFINVVVPNASTFDNYDDTWVQVTVEDLIAATPPEILLPRQKLISAPYAINAGLLEGLASADFVTSTALTTHAALTGNGAHVPAGGITDAEVSGITASSVTDFDTEVSNNADVTANTAARHVANSDNQNLFETFTADAGSTSANIQADTLSIVGGTNASTSITGDILTINVLGAGLDADTLDGLDSTDFATTDSLATHAALTGNSAHIPAGGITDAEVSGITASSVTDFDTEVSNNADVTANTAARHASGSDNQNLFETVAGDLGSTSANIQTDTLSILGGANVSTSVSGDTVTIDVLGTGLDADTLDGLDSTDFATTDSLATHAALTGNSAHIPAGGITDAEVSGITASSVTDFDTEVSNNPDVTANTGARHASGSDNQNLYATVSADGGTPTTADVQADTLAVVGGANITTTASSDQISIAVDTTGLDADTLDGNDSTAFATAAALTAHAGTYGNGAHIPVAGISDSEVDDLTSASMSNFVVDVSAVPDVAANTADRHASGSDNQNLYATISGDGGTPTTADLQADSLAIVGGANITTTASSDQISIAVNTSGLDADTLDAIDSTSFLRSDAADSSTGEIDFQAGIEVETIQNLAGTNALTINAGTADVTVPNSLTISGAGNSAGDGTNATQLTISGVATGAAANATTDRELIVVGDARIDGDLKMGVGSLHMGVSGGNAYLNTTSGEDINIAPDTGLMNVTGRVNVSDTTAPNAGDLISRSYFEANVASAVLDVNGHLPDDSVTSATVVDESLVGADIEDGSLTNADMIDRTRTVFIPSGAFFLREASITGTPNYTTGVENQITLAEMPNGADCALSSNFQLPMDFAGTTMNDFTVTMHLYCLDVDRANLNIRFDRLQDLAGTGDPLTWRYTVHGSAPTVSGDSFDLCPYFNANQSAQVTVPVSGDTWNGNAAAAAGDVFYITLRRNNAADDPNNSSIYLVGLTINYLADM